MSRKKNTPQQDKDIENMLHQIQLINTQFEFYVNETDNLDRQAVQIQDSGEDITPAGCKQIDELYNKVEELHVRYQKDVKIYNELMVRVTKYFKDRYDIDF